MSTPMSSQRRTASRMWPYCGECCGWSWTPMRMGKVMRSTLGTPTDRNCGEIANSPEIVISQQARREVRRSYADVPAVSPHRHHRRPCSAVAALGPARQRVVEAVVVALARMLHAHRDEVVGDDRSTRL